MPRPLSPAFRRLTGLLCIVSGGLLALGLLLKVGVTVYNWSRAGAESPPAMLLSFNLLGLLASGLLMRYGVQMRASRPLPNHSETDQLR